MDAAVAPRALDERQLDESILSGSVLLLVLIGFVVIYGGSSASALLDRHADLAWFVRHQAIASLVGFAGALVVRRLRPEVLWRLTPWAVRGTLLMLLLMPVVGRISGGARRWVTLFGFSFQPSEVAQVAFCLWLARMIAQRDQGPLAARARLAEYLPGLGLFALLILMERDLGTPLVLAIVFLGVLYASGVALPALLKLGAGVVLVATPLVFLVGFRFQRILAFLGLAPAGSAATEHLAVARHLLASGGWFGRGFGEGAAMLGYLPASHNDYALVTAAEGGGLALVIVILLLEGAFVVSGLRVARRAHDPFLQWVATGLSLLAATETFIHAFVNEGLLPSKGLPLPFVSFGGTALAKCCVIAGMLVAVGRLRRENDGPIEPDGLVRYRHCSDRHTTRRRPGRDFSAAWHLNVAWPWGWQRRRSAGLGGSGTVCECRTGS